MSAPVNFFLNESIPLTSQAKEKLEVLSGIKGVCAIAVFPDVHAKPDNPFPTGIALISEDRIFPASIGQDIGCGMAVFKVKHNGSFSRQTARTIFAEAAKTFPDTAEGYKLSEKELFDIFGTGLEWALAKGIIKKEYLDNVENNGNAFSGEPVPDFKRIFPRNVIKSGLRRTSHLGGGNHFMEFQEVTEVMDKDTASKFGLSEGDFILMLHTGSVSLGKRFEVYFTDRYYGASRRTIIKHNFRKAAYQLLPFHPRTTLQMYRELFLNDDTDGFPADSPAGRKYLAGHKGCLNYAYVNRLLVVDFLKKTAESLNSDIEFELLYDVVHESIQREDISGKKHWVHRSGASRAYPASLLPEHPAFSVTGQLLPLPGSMATDSFLTCACEKVKDSYFSVNHGAGRVLEKQQVRQNITEERLKEFLNQRSGSIYMVGNEETLIEQLPDTFKNIDEVLEAISANGLVKPFLRMHPAANIKV